MSWFQVIALTYALGVLPTMIFIHRAYMKEVERGTTTDLSLLTSRRNLLLIFFGAGLSWPALAFAYVVVRTLKPLWKDGPPDDPDDPQEQTS